MNEPLAGKSASAESAGPRGRAPTQRRSIERVERILACATALIAERGSDQMKMSEVADMAGISIGSLYQYFPDKSAIIYALAERLSAGQPCLHRSGSAQSARPRRLARRVLRPCGSILRDFPERARHAGHLVGDAGRQAATGDRAGREPRLRKLLADILIPLRPDADAAKLATSAFLVWQLGEATMRLAVSLGRDEGDAVVAAYKRMALAELLGGKRLKSAI